MWRFGWRHGPVECVSGGILPVSVPRLASEDLYFGSLWWEREVVPVGEISGGERNNFPDMTARYVRMQPKPGYCCCRYLLEKKGSRSGRDYLALFSAQQIVFKRRRPISLAHFTLKRKTCVPCCCVTL